MNLPGKQGSHFFIESSGELKMPWNRDAFLKNWRDALKEAGRQTRFTHEGWEGPIAYRALKKLDLLEVASFAPGLNLKGWRLGWVLREFAAVVDTYEDGAQRVA